MLSQEELEKVYQENFPVGISLEAAAERLAAMDADYVDDIREMFCNNLLYSITQNYTKYADLDFSRDNGIRLFCNNVALLSKENNYFRAVAAFFEGRNNDCLDLLRRSLDTSFARKGQRNVDPSRIVDEYTLVDWFFEPFKEAFPGFWRCLGDLLENYIHTEGIPELCFAIDGFYGCKTDEDALELLLDYLRKLPTSILLKELTGLTYYSLRMWNNAIAYFEAVKETHLFCSDAMLHFCLGVAFGRTKNLKAEEKQYRLALESEPDYPPTLRNLGYCLYRQKKLLAAKEVLEHCLAVSEEDSLAAEYYLKVLVSLKRNKDAKQFLKKGYKVSGSIRKRVEGLDYSNARLRKKDIEEITIDDADEQDLIASSSAIDLGPKRQQFSSERLLEEELTARIEAGIEVFGLQLKIYRREGKYGRQFIIPIGRLDLLCEDEEGNLYIIELKKDSGYDDAYQQTVDYLNWFENHFTDSKKNIYGIICLNSPSQELIKKVRGDKRIRLFEYRITYTEV